MKNKEKSMLDEQKLFRDVVERTKYWHPSKEHNESTEFTEELEEYLERHINRKSLVQDTEKTVQKKDNQLIINKQILVTLEKNFKNRKKASQNIEHRTKDFDYLIYVSCGVKNVEAWRQLEKKYTGTRQRKTQIEFIWKSPELYGVERKSDTKRENPLGGLMDEINEGVKNKSNEETEE